MSSMPLRTRIFRNKRLLFPTLLYVIFAQYRLKNFGNLSNVPDLVVCYHALAESCLPKGMTKAQYIDYSWH